MKKRVSELNTQDARVKAGKLKIGDRLDLLLNVHVSELVISNRPK